MASHKYVLRRVGATATPAQATALANQLRPFFVGPAGAAGAAGASAYQIALANGFVGTEAAWLASLQGADGANGVNGSNGADGADGASAYQIAVANGFSGTEAEWIAFVESGTPVTADLPSIAGTDKFLVFRVVAGVQTPYLVSASVMADYFGSAPAPTAPAAFADGDWTADATSTPGEISFNLDPLPGDGGSPITVLQYQVDAGSPIDFAGTAAGVRVVTAGLTPGVAADLNVRAVNAVGAGEWSLVKNRTPLASGGGGTLTISQGTGADIVGGESATYRSSGGTNDGYWEPGVNSGRMLWRPGSNFNTTNVPGTVTAATLRIYMSEQFGASTVTAYDNLRAWVAGAGVPSWSEYASGSAWQTAGGSGALDRSAASIGTEPAPATNGVWVEIGLDATVVEGWRQAGGVGACGAQLVGNDQFSTFYTDTNTDNAALRPQLVVTYA